MPELVTPAQADTVLEVNRANALKTAIGKVKGKKPLSRGEVELLQSIAYGEGSAGDPNITEAKTVVALAAALGCSRRSISNWRKLDGAPQPSPNGTHDVVAWRKFMREKRLDGSCSVDEESLRVRKLLAEVTDREFRLETRKGLYIEKALVRQSWLQRVGRASTLLRSKLEKEAPPLLVGLDAPAIQERLGAIVDEVLSELHDQRDDSLTP